MSDDLKRGDVVYMRVSNASDTHMRYIGVITDGENFGVKVRWYDRVYNHWVHGTMSHEPSIVRKLGELPEWAEWDIDTPNN